MKTRSVIGEIYIYRRQRDNFHEKRGKNNVIANSCPRVQFRAATINDDFYLRNCYPAERISAQYLSIRRENVRAYSSK